MSPAVHVAAGIEYKQQSRVNEQNEGRKVTTPVKCKAVPADNTPHFLETSAPFTVAQRLGLGNSLKQSLRRVGRGSKDSEHALPPHPLSHLQPHKHKG